MPRPKPLSFSMLYSLPGTLSERTVRPPDWALVSWLKQEPGAHARRCPLVHLQHRPWLHLQRCPSRAPSTTSCSLSPVWGSGQGGAITPGAHPEDPFPLSKVNAVSCPPPQLAWDSSILLMSLARPLTKMHPWPYGSQRVLPEGRGWENRRKRVCPS